MLKILGQPKEDDEQKKKNKKLQSRSKEKQK